MNASRAVAVVSVSLVGLAGSAAVAVNTETVTVGDPGNAADTEVTWDGVGGFGSVGYTYNIGKYEVTAGQYAEFLNTVAGVDTYGLYHTDMSRTDYGSGIARSGGGTVGDPYTYSVAADFVNRPVNYVSYWDACRYANWLHNGQPTGAQGAGTTETGAYTLDGYSGYDGRAIERNPGARWMLPSEDEWYKAAYYKGGSTSAGYWDYPTSSDTAPGRDIADASGNNANYGADPWGVDSGKFTTLVGEYQNSDSPYGTFDQGGNVLEWNEAIVTQGATYVHRSVLGGSWMHDKSQMHAASRLPLSPIIEERNVGFRVAAVPEPSTMALLALSGIGTFARRRWPGR